MSVRMYPWFGVPPGLIKSGLYLKLSPSDKDLCLYLYWKSDRWSSRQFEARDREIIRYMGLSLRSLCDARKKLSKLGIARCERTLGGLYTYTLCDLSTGQPYLGDPKHPIVRPKKDVQKQAVMSPTPINWFEEKKKDKKDGKDAKDSDIIYQSYVTVHRKGDFIMPIEVEVKFDNNEKVREHWDGQSRWTRFSYQKKTKVVSVEIDPDHTIHLDRDNFDNSLLVEPNPKPTHKLSTCWLFLTQWTSQAMAWWAV